MNTNRADEADLQDQRTPVQPVIDQDNYPYTSKAMVCGSWALMMTPAKRSPGL